MAVTLRERDAAKYIGLSVGFLRASRIGRCEGPAYVRAGRAVLYRIADLDEWLQRNTLRTA
jgi:hypothetical protein